MAGAGAASGGSVALGKGEYVVLLPIPYAVPPARYGPRDEPWVASVPHREPDSHGKPWPGAPRE